MAKLPLPFKNHTTYKGHGGIDFPVNGNTPILASGPGKVTFRGWLSDRAGNAVQVSYDNGTVALYCHLAHFDTKVKKNSRVALGTVIGFVGTTGNSTGNHLHVETARATQSDFWARFSKTATVPNRVKTAQQQLKKLGYQPGPIDGIYGPKTAAATKAFQKANELPATGRLDNSTLARIALAPTTPAPVPPPAEPIVEPEPVPEVETPQVDEPVIVPLPEPAPLPTGWWQRLLAWLLEMGRRA